MKFWLLTIFIAGVYLALSIYLTNYRLTLETILGNYSLSYKLNVLFSLLWGLQTAIPRLNSLALIVIAILTGANVTLIMRSRAVRRRPGVSCVATGSSIFGSLASVCSACSLPLLTILGFGVSFLFPPLAIALLSISLYASYRREVNTHES